jgi:hypothetical protein
LAWAGHGLTTAKHRGQREPASTRARSWIKTNAPGEKQGLLQRLGRVERDQGHAAELAGWMVAPSGGA